MLDYSCVMSSDSQQQTCDAIFPYVPVMKYFLFIVYCTAVRY